MTGGCSLNLNERIEEFEVEGDGERNHRPHGSGVDQIGVLGRNVMNSQMKRFLRRTCN